uniref:Protein kinase domain-containing protein n=1 Tax=Panagrolaimus sp. ES5 TaxID=591445 RepID=A0AC34GHM4_9BILA
MVHGAKYKSYIYFATRFRHGPSLNDCWASMPEGKFTPGTAARVVYSISKALEWVHQLGYLLRRIDPNVIKFDATTRQIYLSDLSSVRLDPRKLKMEINVRWAGAPLYAPLQHHQGKSHEAKHDLEAALYLLVEMTIGKLPWDGTPKEMIGSAKRQAASNQTLFKDCPSQYAAIYTYITLLNDADRIEYSQIYSKLEEAWKAAGTDNNKPYDWEANMKKIDEQGQ